MSQIEIIDTRLVSGVWQLAVKDPFSSDVPDLIVQADGKDLDTPRLEWISEVGAWGVTIDVPKTLISDGAHSLLLIDRNSGATIATLPVICGTALTENDRAELSRLRGEIELLKRVIRAQFRSELNAFKDHLPTGTRIVHGDGYQETVHPEGQDGAQ